MLGIKRLKSVNIPDKEKMNFLPLGQFIAIAGSLKKHPNRILFTWSTRHLDKNSAISSYFIGELPL